MKLAKPIFMILIVTSICCSCSMGQLPTGIGKSISNTASRPGFVGLIDDGAGVYPNGYVNNAKVYLDKVNISVNIWRREFLCNLISSCGMYPYGKKNNGDGAIVNLGQATSGETVSGIDGSVVKIVEKP